MTTKLWPMPKIELKELVNTASVKMWQVVFIEKVYLITKRIEHYEVKCSFKCEMVDSFEDAQKLINEWIFELIKENFEPIVLPDSRYSEIFGFGFKEKDLLELNPTAIKETGK